MTRPQGSTARCLGGFLRLQRHRNVGIMGRSPSEGESLGKELQQLIRSDLRPHKGHKQSRGDKGQKDTCSGC